MDTNRRLARLPRYEPALPRRRATRIIGLLVLGLLLGGAPASAQPSSGGRGMGGDFEHLLERHAERLGLSEETSAQIGAIVERSRKDRDTLRDSLRASHEEMRALLSQDLPSEQKVMALADRIGELETRASKHRLSTLLEIRAVLTPEQRKEMTRIHDERRERRGAKMMHALEPICSEAQHSLCGDAAAGRGMLRCMREHRDDLPAECRDAMRRMRHSDGSPRDPMTDGDEGDGEE